MTVAGNLRQRVILLQPLRLADASGGGSVQYRMAGEAWAEVSVRPARPRNAADQLLSGETYTIRMRYRSDVVNDWHLLLSTKTLAIRSLVDPDGRKHWLECLCEEISP